MIRTLRLLAVISFVWIAGRFLLMATDTAGYVPFGMSFVTNRFVESLGGELAFAAGILALVATARRRHIAGFALFALLLVLLNVLPFFIFRPSVDFLALFEAPLELAGQGAWVFLLPALIPGIAFGYTLITIHSEGDHPVVAKATPSIASIVSHKED